jgi:Polyketide cyclase / dehydrase and lipid transport
MTVIHRLFHPEIVREPYGDLVAPGEHYRLARASRLSGSPAPSWPAPPWDPVPRIARSANRVGQEEEVRRILVDVTVHSQAAPEAVFGLLADGTSWPQWSPTDSFVLERLGDPPPEGVGAIRVFGREGATERDRIVEVVPGRRLSYVSLSGRPVRDYRTQIDLEAAGEGTAIAWRASFYPEVVGTGWLLNWWLRGFVEECAVGLAERAAHVPANVLKATG